MGNCCRRGSSSAVWAGDDWEPASPGSQGDRKIVLFDAGGGHETSERQRLLGGDGDVSSLLSSSSSSGSHEVKIRITKRELEELMARFESEQQQGLTMEDLLARLISSESHEVDQHHRPWKPALQSIPE